MAKMGGRREGAGRPNPWGERLRKVTIRMPESLYLLIVERARRKDKGLSYTIVATLQRIKKYL